MGSNPEPVQAESSKSVHEGEANLAYNKFSSPRVDGSDNPFPSSRQMAMYD
jgi:hypothetical protein